MQEEQVVRASVQLSPGGPVKEFRKSFHENNTSFRDCLNEIRTEILDYYGENIEGNPQGFDDHDLEEEEEEEEDPDEKKQKTR